MDLSHSISRLGLSAGLLLGLVSTAQAQVFKPNLKATSLTFSTGSWNAGSKVSFTAQWKNTTTLFAKAGAHLTGLFFSTNSIISTADTLMRAASLSSLNPGATATWKNSVTVPTINTTNGTKYVGLYVDYKFQVKETSESDNILRKAVTYRSGRDLVVSSYSLPSSLHAGSSTILGANVYNGGPLSSTGFFTGFFLSTNSIISHGDHYLGAFYTSSLKGFGTTGLRKISVRIPNVPNYGTYYVGIEADSTYRVVEKSESNNRRAIARTVLAPFSSTRYLEYQSLLQTSSKPTYMSRSQTVAVGYASVGGSVNMRVTAPTLAGGLQLCVWSFKSSWVLDAASNFSLSLTNNAALFPGWFSTLDSKGQAAPRFRLPKGAPLPGLLRVYTKSFLFNKTFKLVGSTNVVRTDLYK